MNRSCVHCGKVSRCEFLKGHLNNRNRSILRESDESPEEMCGEYEESDLNRYIKAKTQCYCECD